MINKITFIRLSFLMVIIAFNAVALPLTCPIRPEYIDCSGPNPIAKMNILPSFWQPQITMNYTACTDDQNIYFKFDTAQYSNSDGLLQCSYTASNENGSIVAFLTLTTAYRTYDLNAPNNDWDWDTDGYDCGHIINTSIYNCPIKNKSRSP